MPDVENVIKGLECCVNDLGECELCPYDGGTGKLACGKNLYSDALALLKAQEPVAPELQSGGNYVCGNCGMYTVGYMHPLTGESVQTWKYCGTCGRAVKWE